MILWNAPEKMKRYNQLCVHYNLVADGVYKARASINDLFDTDYLPYIVAALISFDLGRMMGDSPEKRYALQANGFAGNLYGSLHTYKNKHRTLDQCWVVQCQSS